MNSFDSHKNCDRGRTTVIIALLLMHKRDSEKPNDLLKVTQLVNFRARKRKSTCYKLLIQHVFRYTLHGGFCLSKSHLIFLIIALIANLLA